MIMNEEQIRQAAKGALSQAAELLNRTQCDYHAASLAELDRVLKNSYYALNMTLQCLERDKEEARQNIENRVHSLSELKRAIESARLNISNLISAFSRDVESDFHALSKQIFSTLEEKLIKLFEKYTGNAFFLFGRQKLCGVVTSAIHCIYEDYSQQMHVQFCETSLARFDAAIGELAREAQCLKTKSKRLLVDYDGYSQGEPLGNVFHHTPFTGTESSEDFEKWVSLHDSMWKFSFGNLWISVEACTKAMYSEFSTAIQQLFKEQFIQQYQPNWEISQQSSAGIVLPFEQVLYEQEYLVQNIQALLNESDEASIYAYKLELNAAINDINTVIYDIR